MPLSIVLTEINKDGVLAATGVLGDSTRYQRLAAARSKEDGTLTSPFLGTGWLNAVKFGSVARHGVSGMHEAQKGKEGTHCYTYQDDSGYNSPWGS